MKFSISYKTWIVFWIKEFILENPIVGKIVDEGIKHRSTGMSDKMLMAMLSRNGNRPNIVNTRPLSVAEENKFANSDIWE